ncbi:MAG: hypothetical protein HKN91_11845 [Acidimicrobiia bacterium]|nr:hypothetical protein [Acidimicrobiia bacterium]
MRATLEVVEPPRTNDLYFFALQASFVDQGAHVGGAHIGLQWNRRHPGYGAVNWGGYHSQSRGGAILDGTESPLPSQPNDPNTRDYPWQPNRAYRFEIAPGSSHGWWRGTITDLDSNEISIVRELHGGGSGLAAPVVWCEVFAPCDAPSVTVEWSDLAFLSTDDTWMPVESVSTNYQDFAAGGCTNSNSTWEPGRWMQTTATERTTPTRTILGRR